MKSATRFEMRPSARRECGIIKNVQCAWFEVRGSQFLPSGVRREELKYEEGTNGRALDAGAETNRDQSQGRMNGED